MTPEENFKLAQEIISDYVPEPRPTGWSGGDIIQAHILHQLVLIQEYLADIASHFVRG